MKTKITFLVVLLWGAQAAAQQSTPSTKPAPSPPANRDNSMPAPTFSNGPVAEYVSNSSAKIGWATPASATMGIRYGLDADHMDQTAAATQTMDGRSHHATLQGLKPGQRYFFQITENGK